MASKSHAAQEMLTELEKNSAPFKDQLFEAAKFVGLDLEDGDGSFVQNLKSADGSKPAIYHGREEWLLRWLLKKLQDQKDDAPRRSPNSWILFCHLIRVIPLPNAARMLNERKFMTILRQTLEEAQSATSNGGVAKNTSDVGSGSEDRPSKVSKKRNRSGALISISNNSRSHIQKLPAYIFAAIHQMLRLSKVASDTSEGGRTTAFSTEYMYSVIRTPTEDAAKILGAWLSLCRISLQDREILDTANMKSWLSTFIKIWDCRAVGNEDFMQFSFYCSQPLLSLLKVIKTGKATPEYWMDEMEQLVARNVIIPAKAANLADVDSDLLNTLTRTSVIQDSANAPILFEVAVRSIQAQGSRRRRPNDEAWLQTVFTTLKDSMPRKRAEENGKAIREMLESAIKYNVVLELSTLRSITSEYCFLQGSTNWELLATTIKLDANVFLIQHDGKDLVRQVLTRITAACLDLTWSNLYVQVVSEVLVPLMHGFSKARDLTTFIRYWHGQLVEFENLRNGAITLSSAWENEVIQKEFSKIMEASLTVAQIIQLLDWLSSQVVENPDATCVILQAVAGAISQEDVVDAVGLRLFNIMFDGSASKRLDGRYKWRSWVIFSETLRWATQIGLEEISALWEEDAVPFESLSSKFEDGSLLDDDNDNTVNYERLEILRCACRVWDTSREGTRMQSLARKPVLDFLQLLSRDIKLLPQELVSSKELADKKDDLTFNTIHREIPWMLWASVSCLLDEFPRVLELGTEVEGDAFRELLQAIFWIASVSGDKPAAPPSPWPWNNPDAFPNSWTSLLNDDGVLSNPVLVSLIINIMLSNTTNDANPLDKSPTTNAFAVQCLLDLPIEVFSRKDRERVMKNWLPNLEVASDELSSHLAALDPAVLSLKVKIMQRSTIYEGSKYQDLVSLAGALASATIESVDVSLLCFKELVRRTMSHITANLDQHRNRQYASDALSHLRDNLKTQAGKKHAPKLDFALVALFEVLFGIFTARATQLDELGIIPRSEFLSLEEAFQNCLLSQLESLLKKIRKPSKSSKQADRLRSVRSAIDALAKSNVDKGKVANAVAEAEAFAASLDGTDMEVARRLETLISIFTLSADAGAAESQLQGDISTVYGRQALAERTREFIKTKDQRQKLVLLQSSLQKRWSWTQLDKLWTVRQIIISCEDSRPTLDEDDEATIDLSSIYSLLCSHLWQTTSFRQFSLISETMAMMLRTKSRAMNQWNIDSTLGDITIMCSRNAAALRPARAGSIYTHLCQLLQTLLTSHRLKLEGHFHLVVQAMQSLLRCLFMPLPHSTSKTSKIFAQPPWLSSPKHQLNAKHAAAFTRLVTLICDPSVSSVTRSKHNNLTSATDKAKRMAGQHMQFVLALYVQLQLEMKMLPEVREKMVPGLYAIFDTTTPDMRRMIGDVLDTSGRAVFVMLFKDYQKFGKWKGS